MPDKEARRIEAGAQIDFRALELEIDREIDSLFVPTVQRPGKAKTDAETNALSQEGLDLKKGKSTGEPETGLNLDKLQTEIDREIDNLFVPAAKPEEQGGSVQVVNQHQAKTIESRSFAPDAQSRPSAQEQNGPSPKAFEASTSTKLDALQAEIDREIDNLFVPSAKHEGHGESVQDENRRQAGTIDARPFAPDAQSRPSEPKQSGPSPKAFEASTSAKDDESLPVDTSDPHQYHLYDLSKLVEIFNAAYLSLDWEFSPENIHKFIVALNQLEPFASRSSDAKSVFRIISAVLKRLLDRPRAVNSKLVQLIRDSQGLLTHLLLMDGETGPHEKQRLKDLIERVHELRQRALAVKAETNRRKIDANLPQPPPSVSPDKPKPACEEQMPKGAELPAEEPAACEKTEPGHQSLQVHRENLCLISLSGRCIALPASCLIKVVNLRGKKVLKILKRGYATLADFGSPLRGIKNGIFGEWAKQPAKELKSYRFEPLGLNWPEQVATCGPMAALVTNGQTHWIIFCEIVNFIADAEIGTGLPTEGAIGPFENKSHILVPVFDPRTPLSLPEQLSSESSAGDECRRE